MGSRSSPAKPDAESKRRERFVSTALPHLDSLYSTALRLTQSAEDAEDLVQEAYLRAFRHFDQFRPGTNLRAWLFRILRNAFISDYRRRKNQRFEQLADRSSEILESVGTEPAAGRNDPETLLVERTLDEDVARTLDAIPERYRIVVVLSDLEGFGYREIASILEIPIGTVMSRLYRARSLLEATLAAYARRRGYRRPSLLRKGRSRPRPRGKKQE